MRSKTRLIIAATVVFATVMLTHSCFRPDKDGKSGIPKIDRAGLCRDGGATVNEKTNECECAAGLLWNGVRCEADRSVLDRQPPKVVAKAQPAPAPAPVQEPAPVTEPDEPTVEVTAEIMRRTKPVPPKKAEPEATTLPPGEHHDAVPDYIPRLVRACRIAGGSWLAAHRYCHCPDGKVLMGRRCRLTDGRMTDDVCLRAVLKGRWQGGICECPRGKVFSPGRGGCVEPFTGDSTIMRRICENTVNQGKWIQRLGRCQCPEGHILVGETCTLKTYLRSEDICESVEYGGKWNSTTKRCSCPSGKVWINQTCSQL